VVAGTRLASGHASRRGLGFRSLLSPFAVGGEASRLASKPSAALRRTDLR